MGIYIKNGITKRQFDSFMKQRNGLNKPVIIHTLPENVMFVPDHGDLVDMDYIKDHWPNTQYFGAPVVIPAERSEE